MHPLRSRAAFAVVAALLVVGCATSGPRPGAAADAPALLWEIEPRGGGTVLHLVGSIHIGRKGGLDMPPSMLAAFDKADVLGVEVDIGAIDQSSLQALMVSKGLLPPGESLATRLDPETLKQVEPVLKRLSIPQPIAYRMRPWVLAILLMVAELQREAPAEDDLAAAQAAQAPSEPQIDVSAGVDQFFLTRARGTKQIVELESAVEQIEVLSSLPPEVEDLMLREQVEQLSNTKEQMVAFTTAWEAGDAAMMEQLTSKDRARPEYAPFYEAVFHDRNRKMAERIEAMLADPSRRHFVVVGAGHVVGADGIAERLRANGHNVRQLTRNEVPR